ncbi:hypothetical protein AX17_002652 [Amanita inopinata Kibby_2008]|nr:hypothetical protein AX17_002652 [Amanita inopinata Kibby_2008]
MFNPRHPYTPSPSPPSSPTPCIDSSPPDSPSTEPMILDDIERDLNARTLVSEHVVAPSHVIDPFAASVKANWNPPQYELRSLGSTKSIKRTRVQRDKGNISHSPMSTPPGSVKKMRFQYRTNDGDAHIGPSELDAYDWADPLVSNDAVHSVSREEQEAQIWDDACTRVFNGNGSIDLSNNSLTYVPQRFIEDLEKIYIPPDSLERFQLTSDSPVSPHNNARPLTRSHTAPADVEESGSYLFQTDTRRILRMNAGRTRTIADISLGLPKGEIALYLMANQITTLPQELFNLQKLTILSIRHNRLTFLPPEIKQLTSLHTLNVAYNQLKYLPWEMLQMSLTSLIVHPNPFLEPPNSGMSLQASSNMYTVSEAIHPLPRVIPLVELTLRTLLSPARQHKEAILVTHYELPLPECPPQLSDPPPSIGKKRLYDALPQHLRQVLGTCAPGSVYVEGEEDNAQDYRSNGEHITGIGLCPRLYHNNTDEVVEEGHGLFVRHAEERFTWESKVANADVGARVPIRWRGCKWGCLNFLDKTSVAEVDVEMLASDDAIHVVNFGGGGGALDFDE